VTTALALLIPALLGAPRPPRAAPPPLPLPPASAAEREARLDAYLGFLHGAPPAEAWRALGPEAVPSLARVARRAGEAPSRRAAAVRGLSFLGGAEARAVALALCADAAQPFSVRAAALEAAGRLLAPAELSAALRPVLAGAPRLADRAVAAEVLAARDPVAACGAVRAQQGREAEADRPAFGRALSRCAAGGR